MKAALGSGVTGELPVNAVGFGNVASEHSAKGFSSRIKPPQCYIPIYPIYLDGIKMPSPKQAVKPWAQLDLSECFLYGHQ